MRLGILYATMAALAFGVATPLSKLLLPRIDPLLFAGLLYLGSGLGPGLLLLIRPGLAGAPVPRREWRWLLPAIFCGGVLAPALLLTGLTRISGSTGSLLLNLEVALTAMIAWFVFREPWNGRVIAGIALVMAGGAALSFEPGRAGMGLSWGAAAIAGACLSWSLDNNFTRKVSTAGPLRITTLKGLIAGSVGSAAAFAFGARLPSPATVAEALLLGAASYGFCFYGMILSMRRIGAARMAAWFSTAPFAGVLLSLLLLGDRPGERFWLAAALMVAGLALHATEKRSV